MLDEPTEKLVRLGPYRVRKGTGPILNGYTPEGAKCYVSTEPLVAHVLTDRLGNVIYEPRLREQRLTKIIETIRRET